MDQVRTQVETNIMGSLTVTKVSGRCQSSDAEHYSSKALKMFQTASNNARINISRLGLSAASEALPRVAADQCDLCGQQTTLPRPQRVHSNQARLDRLLRGNLTI